MIVLVKAYTIFSGRLVRSLRRVGIDAAEFELPKGIVGHAKWIFRLMRSEAKIVHYIDGGYPPLLYIVPRLLGKKVVIHWIGSDVRKATSANATVRQKIGLRVGLRFCNLHLAVSEPLAETLKTIGIEAMVIPLVPDKTPPAYDKIPWPTHKTVHAYLPEPDPELYGASTIFRLAEEMRDTNFLVTGHSGKNAPNLPNIKYLGRLREDEMESVWSKAKVLIRLIAVSDGMPQSIIEALARGRYVIWTYRFPFCMQASSLDEAREALKTALAKESPNYDGMVYAREQFNPTVIAEKLKQQYLNLAGRNGLH